MRYLRPEIIFGVTWMDGYFWHGSWERDASELRRIDATSGDVLERLKMPAGTGVSGLESDGAGLLYCGGGASGKGGEEAEARERLN